MTFEQLFNEYSELKETHTSVVSGLTVENTALQHTVVSLNEKLEYQKFLVKKLQHRLFGKKSERRVPEDSKQRWLFEVPEQEDSTATPSTVEVAAHTRTVQTSEDEEKEAPEGTFPTYLPRVDRIIDEKPEGVPEEDLELMVTKVTERLGSTPEQHHVVRIIRKTYKQKSSGKIFTPPTRARPCI